MKAAALHVFVHQLAAARQFYEQQLGLPPRAGAAAPGRLAFELGGGIALVVEAVDPEAPEEQQMLAGRDTGLAFSVADIQLAHRQLLAGGVFFCGKPERQSDGSWLAAFEDPSGNRLRLVQPAPR